MDNIQVMAGHYLKLLVCFVVLLNAHAQGPHNVSITILHSAVEKGAVCLDGSPPAYYHDKGYGDGAKNWLLFIQGGAWCYDDKDCLNRLETYGYLASSNHMPASIAFGGMLNQTQTVNPDFYNWNKVFIAYCDGASFSSDIKEVNPQTNIHHRGARIFKAIIKDLLAKGMKNANNAILAGQSAGGLTAMLHCDQFRKQLPYTERVKCLSDGGYFIQGKDIPGTVEFTIAGPYQNVVPYHRMEKFLPKSCTSKMDAKSCLYPENFVGDMKTPLFLVNSAFDPYQITYKVHYEKTNWRCLSTFTNCSSTDFKGMTDFRTSFIKALPKSNSKIGYYVDSCFMHDHIQCDPKWNNPSVLSLKNKTVAKAFADWYFDRECFQEIDTDENPRVCVC